MSEILFKFRRQEPKL